MTEEKLAEEYVNSQENKLYFGEHWIDISSVKQEAFLAGLKAGRSEWHYVKSEKDLPKDNSVYLLLLEYGVRVFGYYNGKCWESLKGYLPWEEVKAYFFVPVPELSNDGETE